MEDSILKSIKKVLGLVEEDTGYDVELISYINSAFVVVQQLGALPVVVEIEDATRKWSDVGLVGGHSALVRSYINLKVQSYWDPPTTSFLIDLKTKQLTEHEVRLNTIAEVGLSGQ